MQSNGTFYTQDGVCLGTIDELKITNTIEDSEELPELTDFTIPATISFTGTFEGNLNHIIYPKAERKIWNLLKTAKSKRQKKKQIKRYYGTGMYPFNKSTLGNRYWGQYKTAGLYGGSYLWR